MHSVTRKRKTRAFVAAVAAAGALGFGAACEDVVGEGGGSEQQEDGQQDGGENGGGEQDGEEGGGGEGEDEG